MNYYARYFDNEEVFNNIADLTDFLSDILHDGFTQELANEVVAFCSDKTNFPRHFRLPDKTTFIIIKTNSQTLEEFKTRGANGGVLPASTPAREEQKSAYDEINPGTYDVTIVFRRAIVNPDSRKCLYVDETFQAQILADSQRQCYDTVLDYLRNNPEVDARSQYPSIRSNNFQATLIQQ